ncbi:hypothetical protein D3C87_1927760 [compost metagenome]
MHLTEADVHGEDLGRAAIQTDLGEAAGRGADVQNRPPLDHDRPQVQRAFQLQRPAPDPAVGGGVTDLGVLIDRL